jgi:hypothetical protein
MEHVLGAVSRPHGEQLMIVIAEAAATSHGDEPRIPDLGEDHQSVDPALVFATGRGISRRSSM